jgi:hypothetical protein
LTLLALAWSQHSLIAKFNKIRPDVYTKFSAILCHDLVSGRGMKQGGTASDPTQGLSRRLGLMRMPLACVILRIVVHSFKQTQLYAGLWEVQQAPVLVPHPTLGAFAAAATGVSDVAATEPGTLADAAQAATAARRLLEKKGSITGVSAALNRTAALRHMIDGAEEAVYGGGGRGTFSCHYCYYYQYDEIRGRERCSINSSSAFCRYSSNQTVRELNRSLLDGQPAADVDSNATHAGARITPTTTNLSVPHSLHLVVVIVLW